MNRNLTAFGIVLAALASSAWADLIYTDAYGEDWKGHWSVDVQSERVFDGQYALRSSGGIRFDVAAGDGLLIHEAPLLEAYVNFLSSDASPGHSITSVRARATDGSFFEFDDRGPGWEFLIDGVSYVDAREALFDDDPETWQLFQIDLSQIDYAGWPIVEQQIGARAIEQVSFSPWRNTTGNIDILVDNVRLVPEPTMLVLLGVGCILMLRRRA